MSIVIFGDSFSFPEGNAATNRVYTYAKGFNENGKSAYVICFRNDYNNQENGIINGIKFYLPFGQRKRNKNFLARRWIKLVKYFKTITLFRKINNEDKIEAIIIYNMEFTTYLFAWILSRINRAVLIKECGEHPLRLYQNGILKIAQGKFNLYVESHLSDGILCISNFLIEFYKNRGYSVKKLLLTPSTVDPGRFIKNNESPLPYPYLGYFGGLTFKRDNIDGLLQAFSDVCKKHTDIHLVLGGFGSGKDKEQIIKLINNLKISSKVLLLDYLSRNEVIKYITNAKILVMVRGNDLESQASFPSKLTEYLCTSIPLVTVNVGEISEYLSDGKNAFLVEPKNNERLVEKLDFVLQNYDYAKVVALKGKELTNNVFNYNFQAKRIISFINSI